MNEAEIKALLNETDKDIIRGLCEYNMNLSKTSRGMYLHRNTVKYRCERIFIKTGLDPENFHDLVRLKAILDGGIAIAEWWGQRCGDCALLLNGECKKKNISQAEEYAESCFVKDNELPWYRV